MTLALNPALGNYPLYAGALGDISAQQAQSARSLLSMLDGFGLGNLGQGRPSPLEMMMPPPQGYMRGSMAQALSNAAGFLRQFQASCHMDVSMGSRMLLGLSMFSSNALGGGGFSIQNRSSDPVGSERTVPSDKDKFATHESCRSGADNPSNLNNSPHVKLALYNILKDHHDNMKPETLQKELEDKYGIKSELTTVKGSDGKDLKTLKFENGDQLCDASGNGSFGMADYGFKAAIADIKEQYGITPEDFDKMVKENPQVVNQIGAFGANDNTLQGGGNFGALQGNFAAQFAAVMPYAPYQSMFPMRDIATLFAQAYALAQQ